MGEKLGLTLNDRVEPGPGPFWSSLQSLELTHGPSDEMLIDAPCKEVQLGAVEGPVIADPASDPRIDLLGEAGQVRSTAPDEVPIPDLLALRLLRRRRHRRREVRKEPPPALRPASPEGVAEEVETGVLRFPGAVRVLAVHDLCLLGVQLEPHGLEPDGEVSQQRAGLFLSVAVDDRVIRVALEGLSRILSDHPPIERIVHEEVRQ